MKGKQVFLFADNQKQAALKLFFLQAHANVFVQRVYIYYNQLVITVYTILLVVFDNSAVWFTLF